MAENDVTGDRISQYKKTSDYYDNFDNIFRKDKPEVKAEEDSVEVTDVPENKTQAVFVLPVIVSHW